MNRAILSAFIVAGLTGNLFGRTVIRCLGGRLLETLWATWSISLILQQAVRSVFGLTNKEVITPSWMSGSIELAGGLSLTMNRIAILIFALGVFAGLMALMRKSAIALQKRAVTQNRQMANAMASVLLGLMLLLLVLVLALRSLPEWRFHRLTL